MLFFASLKCVHTKEVALWLLTSPGVDHEVSHDGLAVLSILVGGQQRVQAVVQVGGAVQLQAAVILSLRDVVDHGHDVIALQHHLAVQQPL